ncbi:MAG: sigma-70 family RNA polymerase sigma factor [Oscillospiraceae bacterium]|nr:sigma-70 family RNA polymerase sigma factor [Oscillospiraceae bacterium]
MKSVTESELVRAARSGDQSAFEALVKANQAMAYQLAYRMTGNPEDAADLTQEAFLNAWRGLAAFDGRASFSTWLYRLTSNACIDFLRREKRRVSLSMTLEDEEDEEGRQAQLPDSRYSPERELEKKEAAEAVRRGLAALSDEHREVLVLRELEGLSYTEIAQTLSLEEGTVKSRIARARLALREFLQKEGNFFKVPASKE